MYPFNIYSARPNNLYVSIDNFSGRNASMMRSTLSGLALCCVSRCDLLTFYILYICKIRDIRQIYESLGKTEW